MLPPASNPASFSETSAVFRLGAAAMAAILALSNYLVLQPINDWLTWGHFSYPLAFFVTDCVNRAAGPRVAKKVVAVGFFFGVPLSFAVNALFPVADSDILTAAARVAVASGVAFACGQGLDVAVFNRLRESAWWRAPAFSSAAGSVADTFLFYCLAFAEPDDIPWTTWAPGDLAVKCAISVADTFLFYCLAFAGPDDLPWTTWALGDLAVKCVMLAALLPPYRFFILRLAVARGATA